MELILGTIKKSEILMEIGLFGEIVNPETPQFQSCKLTSLKVIAKMFTIRT